jgi:hypothetical protein
MLVHLAHRVHVDVGIGVGERIVFVGHVGRVIVPRFAALRRSRFGSEFRGLFF